jgi:hypothetical protein
VVEGTRIMSLMNELPKYNELMLPVLKVLQEKSVLA